MIRRRKIDSPVEYRHVYKETEERNLKDTFHFTRYDQSKSASPSQYSHVQSAIDFPELELVVSDSISSKVLPQKKYLSENPLYYTANLDEGFASTEVVTGLDTQHEDEEDIYIATPVEISKFPSSSQSTENESLAFQTFSTSQRRKRRLKSGTFLSKGLDFQPSSEPDSTSNESESDDEFFTFLSDEETQFSFSSSVESDNEDIGNMPNFDKLDVAVTVETKFRSPSNPLVSKRMPTATATFQSGRGSPETRDFLTPVISATETTQKEKHTSLVTKSNIRPATNESNATSFCSTNVQSALLGKLTIVSEASDLNRVASFILPKSPSGMEKKTKSPTKQKSPKTTKTVKGRHGFGIDVENVESEVDKAFKESLNEGSVMPILKQELQYKIQVRRLSRGEPELILEPEEPKKYEYSVHAESCILKVAAEDTSTLLHIKAQGRLHKAYIRRKNKEKSRLEQNRRSADKSRQKAKVYQEKLLKTIKVEMTENARLKGELAFLVKERKRLQAMHDDHMKTCKRTPEQTQ